jgi:uncharacterized protein (TIGR02246 family)
MRARWIIAAIVVAGLVAPASAQQASQSARQQIERLVAAYVANFNKQDAAGIASLYTKDGVLVSARGVNTGPQQIEQNLFKTGVNHDEVTVDQVSQLGHDAAISLGEYHVTGQGQTGPIKIDGHYTAVDVRQGGAWKVRLLTAVPNPPPPAK